MDKILEFLPILLVPKNLVTLLIVFLVAYWLLSTLKFVSSMVIKVLVALLIVTIVAYFLGIDIIGKISG